MIKQLWLKEIKASLYTWKSTAWLLIASLLFSFTSYLLLTNKELSLLDQTEMLWLLGKIIIGVAFFIVAIDASSIITSEFEKETAESLFLTPLSLRQFILGKFLASLSLWFLVFLIAVPYMIVTSAGTSLLWPFLFYSLLLGTLGIVGLVLVIFAISLIYRSSKNTLSTSLVLLMVFAIPALFSSTLKNNAVSDLFARINPIDNVFSSLDNVLVDYQITLSHNWQYLWPLLIFGLLSAGWLAVVAKKFKTHDLIKDN